MTGRWGAGTVTRLVTSWAVIAVVLVLVPIVITSPAGRFLACTVLVYAGLAVTWNLTLGLAGIANFAHLAFFAVGAYASAILTSKTSLSPWLGIPIGMAVAAVCGLVAFVPVLRLRGIYVALVTFIFSQLFFFLALNQSALTGGASGLVGLPSYTIGDLDLGFTQSFGYYIVFAIAFLAVVIVIDLVTRSTFGRGLIALRDREPYAISRGVPAFRQQLIAFVLSAALAGAFGAMYSSFVGVVAPELFGFNYTTLVLSILFLGGVGSNRGPILAAVVVGIVSDQLKNAGPWRFIVIGAIIMVVLWLFPGGLAGLWRRLLGWAAPRWRRIRGRRAA